MSPLAPGLLVAAPPLADPNFDRTVVLLAQHSAEGSFGWIINGRQVMTMQELLVRAEITDAPPAAPQPVRLGGPVSQEQVWLLFGGSPRLTSEGGGLEICEGVIASASRRVLEQIGEGEMPERLLGLVGYAGWGPSQLEEEIRAGAWLTTDVDAAFVFDLPASEIWTRAYERLGMHPGAFAGRVIGSA